MSASQRAHDGTAASARRIGVVAAAEPRHHAEEPGAIPSPRLVIRGEQPPGQRHTVRQTGRRP